MAHFLLKSRVFGLSSGFNLVVYERLPELSSVLSTLAKGSESYFKFGFGVDEDGVQEGYRIPLQEGADLE